PPGLKPLLQYALWQPDTEYGFPRRLEPPRRRRCFPSGVGQSAGSAKSISEFIFPNPSAAPKPIHPDGPAADATARRIASARGHHGGVDQIARPMVRLPRLDRRGGLLRIGLLVRTQPRHHLVREQGQVVDRIL